MAKDGSLRGGARPGSGKKRKSDDAAWLDGDSNKKVVKLPTFENVPDMDGTEMPPVKEYMTRLQADGNKLQAEEIYNETLLWLRARGCEKDINPQLLERYAMDTARWIDCENMVSKYGYLGKHPTTGGATYSPFTTLAKDYQKQANAIWFQIQLAIRDTLSEDAGKDDLMERLLESR